MRLAEVKTFQYDIPVSLTAENIYLAHYRESQKVRGGLIPDFIAFGKFITHVGCV